MRATYVVSLACFERNLLDSTRRSLRKANTNGAMELRNRLFEHWEWAREVRQTLEECLSTEKKMEYEGDTALLSRLLYHTLEHSPEYGNRKYRTSVLQNDNSTLFSESEDIAFPDLDIVPNTVDEEYWETLAAMFDHSPGLMEAVTHIDQQSSQRESSLWQTGQALKNTETFSIWRVVRMFETSLRRPQNGILMKQSLIATGKFRSRYEIDDNGGYYQKDGPHNSRLEPAQGDTENLAETQGGTAIDRLIAAIKDISDEEEEEEEEEEESIASSSGLTEESDTRNDDLDKTRFDDSTFIDAFYGARTISDDGPEGLDRKMKMVYRRHFHSIPDPAFFVEYVPFEGFTNIIQLPSSSRTEYFGTWSAPDCASLVHQIFTEEEVYQYCIRRNWQFPDQQYQNGLAVILTPIQETSFIEDLQNFWTVWSDCKVTENLQGEVLLVQSIPGSLFRDICVKRDQTAARKHFYRLALDHSTGLDSTISLKTLLRSVWRRDYLGLVDYIPREELSHISKQPLGTGAHGSVFSATWKQANGLLGGDILQYELRGVVLKQIFNNATASETNKESFFRELQATQLALSGMSTGCINFYGVTEIPSEEIDAAEDTPTKILCLVFERASGGTILSYIDRHIHHNIDPTLSNKMCWKHLLLTFEMLFNGLITLHDHGILHRDLHFNNVLARTNTYETEIPSKQKLDVVVLADLGEGKVIDEGQADKEIVVDQKESARSYLAGEFKPPEIKGRKGWSAKGDVYCLGVMMEKIVIRESEKSQNKFGIAGLSNSSPKYMHFQIPKAFKDFCRTCLLEDPAQRPTARSAVRLLEKLYEDLERDRCDWLEVGDEDEDSAEVLLY